MKVATEKKEEVVKKSKVRIFIERFVKFYDTLGRDANDCMATIPLVAGAILGIIGLIRYLYLVSETNLTFSPFAFLWTAAICFLGGFFVAWMVEHILCLGFIIWEWMMDTLRDWVGRS